MQKLDEINNDDCYQNYMYFWPILVKLIYSEKTKNFAKSSPYFWLYVM